MDVNNQLDNGSLQKQIGFATSGYFAITSIFTCFLATGAFIMGAIASDDSEIKYPINYDNGTEIIVPVTNRYEEAVPALPDTKPIDEYMDDYV